MGCLSLTAATTSPAPWHGPPWMPDYEAARLRAEAEGKDLLVHFAGSDWSEWCVRLNRDVFAHRDFIAGCTNGLVLVVLDFPCQPDNKAAIPKSLADQYVRLRNEFRVGSFPTVLLVDPHQLPFGRFGYSEGNIEAVLARIRTLLDMKDRRDEAMARLDKESPTGIERARMLHTVLEAVPRNIADVDYRDLMAEIVDLDRENEAKLRLPYQVRLQRLDAVDVVRAGRVTDAIKIYEDLIDTEKPTGQLLQDLWFERSTLHGKARDVIGQFRCLEAALAAHRGGRKALEIHALLRQLGPEVRDLKKELYSGQVISTMGAHVEHPLEHAYDGDVPGTYYLSDRAATTNDVVALILDEARDVKRVGVYTGQAGNDGGQLKSGVLEVSPDGTRFQTIATFKSGRAQARISGAKLKVVRIRATAAQNDSIMVREFLLD